MTVHTQTGLLPADLLCPTCNNKGVTKDSSWQCNSCNAEFDFEIRCDACKEPVQRLTGCGCSEHFYCRSCKTPKSRKAVIYEMQSH